MHSIALVSTNYFKFSETFIQNHKNLLPANVHYLHGGYLPACFNENQHFIENPGNQQALKKAIIKYLVQNNIKAVLAEYGPSGVEMMDICDETGIPLIVHFHGYDVYRHDVLLYYGKSYPKLFEKACALVVVSNHMKNHLENSGAPAHKIVKTVCGADEKQFNLINAGNNPPIFLFAGRFDELKSPHLAILAFAEVVKEVPESRMIMIGNGHLMQACQILIKSLRLTGSVELKGAVSHEEVIHTMQGCRSLILPSITTPSGDREGTPVVILEAGLSGLPVVSTFHAGIPDVIINGSTGFLVEESDIAAMAQKMIVLAREPQTADALGKAAHEVA
ncbi:MAG TPA: glycosyltransferase, partial [Flavobacterium sp.]|nr:glycosyltransferase [Flavobacterium sp.]